jgi:flap endonuclease-1
MGIKNLNRFLHKHCTSNAIQHTHISAYKHTTLVIDTSIFMYKFLLLKKTQQGIIHLFQIMVDLFRTNDITPIFIFDGKPPEEKMKLLKERYCKKVSAYKKAEELKQLLETSETTPDIQDAIKREIEIAETNALRLRRVDILAIKTFIRSLNIGVIESEQEADELCVKHVKSNQAFAVISDDMDMLVHGCPATLRNLDVYTGECTAYLLDIILYDLNMTLLQFREIMVLSGTDYCSNMQECDLYKTLKLYTNYKRFLKANKWRNIGFLDYVIQYTNYVVDENEIRMAYHKFTYTDQPVL